MKSRPLRVLRKDSFVRAVIKRAYRREKRSAGKPGETSGDTFDFACLIVDEVLRLRAEQVAEAHARDQENAAWLRQFADSFWLDKQDDIDASEFAWEVYRLRRIAYALDGKEPPEEPKPEDDSFYEEAQAMHLEPDDGRDE